MSFIRILIVGLLVAGAFALDGKDREAILQQAQSRVVWVWQTCDRDPEFCTRAHSAWTGFVEHAERALVVSFEFVRLAILASPEPSTVESAQPIAETTLDRRHPNGSSGNLRQTDLEPAWAVRPR